MSTSDRSEERPEIAELQENFHKQQAKISALKELVRKSEEAQGKSNSFTQEKVKNIAQRLTHLKSKARSRQNLDKSLSEIRDDPILEESPATSPRSQSFTKAKSETPGSEKIQLLRQQVEKNKLKMAERENSKREIEELVTQLKAKMDSTQQSLERSSELGRSMGDLTSLNLNPVSGKFKSSTDLSFTPLNLDKEKIKFLENRVKILEKQLDREKNAPKTESEIVKTLENKVLDLEESLKEKECIIQARTQAVSLMTESLSAKGKNTVDMLEDTRLEMFKMQSSFIDTEDTLKDEIQQLKELVQKKERETENLDEVNKILENARFELTVKIAELESKMQDAHDYSTKINELNKLNESLQHRISDLESQRPNDGSFEESNVAQQVAEEYANQLKNLQERINDLEKENDDLKKLVQESQMPQNINISDTDIADKIKSLEGTIAAQREEIESHVKKIQQLEDQLAEKTIEYNVLNANFSVLEEKLRSSTPKSLFSKSTYDEAETEINKLKSQLDEANKSMIKMKLKTKQLKKQVDEFNKISDVHAEVVKVTGENEQLQQKIVELEEEKGQLQLKLLSGEPSEISDSEIEKKIQILETTCQNQTSAIQLLEEQKLDMTENLQTTKQELESLKDQMNDRDETARVVSQIESIQLEETVGSYLTEIDELRHDIEQHKAENTELKEFMEKLQQEKEELSKRVDHYLAENIELLDKVEKLSKSSSSAESIEIVERLTQHEKLEIEAFNKGLDVHHTDIATTEQTSAQTMDEGDQAMGEELSESLTKLREESSELMHRIELFTTERREVLEKMEILSNENQEHLSKINELTEEKISNDSILSQIMEEKNNLEKKYEALQEEKSELVQELADTNKQRESLTQQLNLMKKEKNSVTELLKSFAAGDGNLIKNCEKSISRLNTEIENYNKATDRSGKTNASKKLVKEAKNTSQQISGLLEKLKALPENVPEQEECEIIVEKQIELEGIIEKLRNNLEEVKTASENKNTEICALTTQLESLKKDAEHEKGAVDQMKESYENEISRLTHLRKDIELKLQTANNEVEILKTLVTEQKQQLIDTYTEHETEVSSKVEKLKEYELEIADLKKELKDLENSKSESYEKYMDELKPQISKLEILFEESKALAAEQAQELINKQETIETLNDQIVGLYKSIEELTNATSEKEEEIAFIQEIMDSKKAEMDRLVKENHENKNVIEKLLLELHSHTEKIAQVDALMAVKEENRELHSRIGLLEKLSTDYELRCKEQHDKLKKFAANLKKKVAQCSELETKLKEVAAKQPETGNKSTNTTDQDSGKILALTEKLQEAGHTIAELQNEKSQLRSELDNKLSELETAQHQSALYLAQIEDTSRQLDELPIIVEKLRSDFEEKRNSEQELRQNMDIMLSEAEEKLQAVKDDLHKEHLKFEKCKAVVKDRNREIQRLNAEKEHMSQALTSFENMRNDAGVDTECLREENDKLKQDHALLLETYEREKAAFEATIAKLETLHNGIQAKLQEDMAYIETLETENNKFKENIYKLEECVACFEERRASLERQANLLDAQLQEKTHEYEQNEDALVYRLNMLSEHDDVIARRLLETQEEKEQLSDKLEHSCREFSELKQRFAKLEKDFDLFKEEKYLTVEQENQALRDQVGVLQTELNKLQSVYESKLSTKTAEIDELENELSLQLQNVNSEKRSLQENLEKARDELQALKDENVRLKESSNSLEQIKNDLEREITWIRMQNENLSQDQFELQELRMQVMQDKTEIENQKHQIETLTQNHEIELNVLRNQISELDTMRMQVSQNQTDDQVFIETENKRLKELLTEKEALIDNYQKENLKLQMSAMAAVVTDPFATIAEGPAPIESPDFTALKEKCRKYESEISELKTKLCAKEDQQCKLSADLTSLQQEVQRIAFESQREIESLRSELDKHKNPRTDIASAFMLDQPTPSVFDEIVTRRDMQPVEADVPEQKKIEDLERNVSDLEKYATELESKLKHLTAVHEETLKLLHQKTQTLEELQKTTGVRIKELEKKETQLNKQQNIEHIWDDKEPQAYNSGLSMFFDNVSQQHDSHQGFNQFEQQIPVEEEVIVPKKAYICHPSGEACKPDQQEGWEWGSEEAALEERHYHTAVGQQLSLLPPQNVMEIKLQEHQDRIRELELERNHLEEQKIELQIKSGKMMKKLKEYKTTITQLTGQNFRKSASIESNDLDLAIQEELKSQMSKLEEKVSEMKKQIDKDLLEKEGLLKRIDVLTLANERMTEMKERQDIDVEMYLGQIRQLNQKIKTLEEWSEHQNQSAAPAPAVQNTVSNQDDWEKKYLEVSRELEDLRVDKDELQALLEEEKENHKINENKIKTLKEKIDSLQEAPSQKAENQALKTELNEFKLRNQDLQMQLSDYQETMEQLSFESNSIKANLDLVRAEHERKLNENSKLSQELQNLVEKNADLSREVEAMRLETRQSSQVADIHRECEQRIKELEEKLIRVENDSSNKSNEIAQLSEKIQQCDVAKGDIDKEIIVEVEQLKVKVTSLEAENTLLTEKNRNLEKSLEELRSEKEHMEQELQVLNNHVMATLESEDKMRQTVLELDMKNIEIAELKNSLEILKIQGREETQQTNNETQSDLQQINVNWEAVIEQRCGEVAESWRAHLEEREDEFKQIQDSLQQEIETLKSQSSVTQEDTKTDEELGTSISPEVYEKMQTALENQEMEIVTLKEQLATRSAEYARLAAQHDPYAQNTSSSIFDINLRKNSETLVPKSELDFAFYMLHQRDMRCEELTLELMNLLEERDTLQLKLSNSLRHTEDIKRKTGYSESGSESDQGSLSNPNSPEKHKVRTSAASVEEAILKENEHLNTKISQLHAINHPKDKRVWDERDQRQRDLGKMQEDVANMPQEAVSELVGQDLSNTDQSPSTVLLNWFWGKTSSSPQS